MSDCTINGRPILEGSLSLPLSGAWMAHLELDASENANTSTTLPTGETVTIAIGDLTFVGTVRRQGVYVERLHVEVVGGALGLSSPVPAQAYQGVPLSIPLADILALAGETASTTIAASARNTFLTRWARASGTAGLALDQLAASQGFAWRVLADGSVWIGTESWDEVTIVADVTDEDKARDTLVIASEHPAVYPGTTFLGRKVSTVVHQIGAESIRTIVHFASSDVDRSRKAFEALVLGLTQRYDYHGGYRSKVLSQNSDGTLELRPEGSRMPPVSRVPIRHGIPGVEVKVKQGGTVLLEFEDGDPSKPFATLWQAASLDEIKITAEAKAVVQCPNIVLGNESDARPIARIGDPVQLMLSPTTVIQGAIVGPVPGAFTGTLVVPGVLYGVIAGGGKVKGS